MTDLTRYLNGTRGFDRFLTVDEIDDHGLRLHAAGLADAEVIGESRAGHPLRMLSAGHAARSALVIGMPHPNEPAGALAALRLAELLTGDAGLRRELGFRWHVIPCADPDGARLNEGWFAGPFTRAHYAANMHRPPFPEQFEWTFHRADLPEPGLPVTPESQAVMSVLDALRPELVISLHNAEAGGLYCYVTDTRADLGPGLKQVSTATGLPLDLGEPEEPAERPAPGIFHVPPNLTGGAQLCSTDYAARYGAFGLIPETPLWVVPGTDDLRPAGDTTATIAALRASLAVFHEQHTAWIEAISRDLDLDTPRGRAITVTWERHWLPDSAAAMSRASLSSLAHNVDLERLRGAGQVVSFLRQATGLSRALTTVLSDAENAVTQWSDGARMAFVGLTGAVRAGVGTALVAAQAYGTAAR